MHVFPGDTLYSVASRPALEMWYTRSTPRRTKYAPPATSPRRNRGRYGFARVGTGTDPQQRFVVETVKPGRIAADEAPHINVTVMMRGILTHAFTRVYFDDEAAKNATDPVLALVPEDRRSTLIAKRQPDGSYRFEVRLQGDNETVFFDV